MDFGLKFADLAIVFATLLGPVLAVQAQKWVERGREQNNRRVTIFRTLMATRAASLSPAHVEALNAIPIEFYGDRKAFKDVVEAWRAYLDYLSQQGVDPNVWAQKRYDLFIELLWRLAESLGYRFTKVELQREVYSPKAYATIESQNEVIRTGLSRIFSGEAALPLDIKTFPADPSFIKRQVELQEQLLSWLAGQRTVKVQVETTSK
jgi:hypothetical protein